MNKDIYTALGFKKATDLIYSNKLIDEAKALFNSFPLKLVSMRQLIVEENVFVESFAISTAEDSDLTIAEAKKIEVSPEVEARLIKYRHNKKLSKEAKYRHLEFENIKNTEYLADPIPFKDLSIELICNLHFNLTVGLDEYCKSVGHSKYHAGELRKTNRIKVGKLRKYTPPDHRRVKRLLGMLIKEFSSKKKVSLADILEFHVLFYAIHPFSNGNKRVARLIESMLLHHYGYGVERMLSLSVYYSKKSDGFNLFLLSSLKKKDPAPFINYALRGYFNSGQLLLNNALSLYIKSFCDNFKKFIEQSIPEKYHKRYEDTLASIMELNGLFTHGEFIREMKKRKYTLGISQKILEQLRSEKILKHQKNLYFLDKDFEINFFLEKFNKFLLVNGINLDED